MTNDYITIKVKRETYYKIKEKAKKQKHSITNQIDIDMNNNIKNESLLLSTQYYYLNSVVDTIKSRLSNKNIKLNEDKMKEAYLLVERLEYISLSIQHDLISSSLVKIAENIKSLGGRID